MIHTQARTYRNRFSRRCSRPPQGAAEEARGLAALPRHHRDGLRGHIARARLGRYRVDPERQHDHTEPGPEDRAVADRHERQPVRSKCILGRQHLRRRRRQRLISMGIAAPATVQVAGVSHCDGRLRPAGRAAVLSARGGLHDRAHLGQLDRTAGPVSSCCHELGLSPAKLRAHPRLPRSVASWVKLTSSITTMNLLINSRSMTSPAAMSRCFA